MHALVVKVLLLFAYFFIMTPLMTHHLAILKKPYVDAILAGSKTVEARLTKGKYPPFNHLAIDDTIFLKISSGPVCAVANVCDFKQFENLTPEKILTLRQQYNHLIGGADDYWQQKSDCPFGLLIWLKNPTPISPVNIRKLDWRAWVILTQEQNYGLL